MKQGIFYSLLITLIVACSSSDENKVSSDVIGVWQLSEVLADPGDGSGVFESVQSDKTIEFRDDGTVFSNGDLCTLSTEVTSGTSGTFSLVDNMISSDDCTTTFSGIRFSFNEDKLSLTYPCIEACQAKYLRQ